MDTFNKLTKYLKFQVLIHKLLINLGNVDLDTDYFYNSDDGEYTGIDIVMGGSENYPLTVVEIKYYRPFSKPSGSVLFKAIRLVKKHMEYVDCSHGLLIISCDLQNFKPNDLYELKNSNIEIWDLNTLLDKAKKFPDILEELNYLLELDKFKTKILINDTIEKKLSEGDRLISKYKLIQSGRKDAYVFENWCIDVLKYLFGEYLTGWHEQSETVDGLNIRDLICRVKRNSEAEIWELILNTLRSRYVVFEFKNYTEEISQREIITTERYLYPTALRNCAFILSREGASKNAKSVIEGAMREHGKLIISLNYNDIEKMLKGKDDGDDPNVYLFEKVDEFLIGLGR